MKLYTQAFTLPNLLWPEPMETVWRLLGTGPSVQGSKIPHVSVADQLFVAAVANTPRPIRPWGAITWLASMFQISRPTIYDLGKRAARGLEPAPGGRPAQVRPAAAPLGAPSRDTITVTQNRMARTALAMAFPVGRRASSPKGSALWYIGKSCQRRVSNTHHTRASMGAQHKRHRANR